MKRTRNPESPCRDSLKIHPARETEPRRGRPRKYGATMRRRTVRTTDAQWEAARAFSLHRDAADGIRNLIDKATETDKETQNDT